MPDQPQMSGALRVLFGPAVPRFDASWKAALRRAFHRRARETHPDRAASLGRSEAEMADEFRRVVEAFAILDGAAAEDLNRPGAADAPVRVAPKGRRLRFSELLYYSGRISWHDHLEALAWQRRMRPALGRLALDWSFLSQTELSDALCRHVREGRGERLGDFLVRGGYLSPFQLLALLGKQRMMGYPIGRFFVERGLCTQAEVDDIIARQRQASAPRAR